MAKHRKFRTGKTQAKPNAYQLIANRMTASILSDDQFSSAAAFFLDDNTQDSFTEKLTDLYEKERFRNLFNAPTNKIEDFYKNKLFYFSDIDRALEVSSHVITAHANEINQFVKCRRRFESLVLEGKLDEALSVLENITERVGESLWYIRNKILILSLKGSLQEMQDFAESCSNRCTEDFISFLIRCFLLVASDPLLHLKKRVLNSVKELGKL